MKRRRKNGDKKGQEEKMANGCSPVTSAEEGENIGAEIAPPSEEPAAALASPAASDDSPGQEEIEHAREAIPAEPLLLDEALEATLKLMEPKTVEHEQPVIARETPSREFLLPDINGSDPLGKLGAALKARREELAISFAEITKRTCITKSTILAMESQPLDKLDAAFYIKNRLALYASALDIDPKIIKDFFEKTIATKESAENPPEKQPPAIWALVIGLVVALLLLGTIIFI